MNELNRAYSPQTGAGSMDMSVNAGLRAFMLGVYQKLALGIALAGGLAFIVGTNTFPPLTNFVLFSPFRFIVQFGPIALILFSAFAMRRPSPLGTAILYWTIVTLLGLSLSVWVLMATMNAEVASRAGIVYGPTFITIAKAFFLTASAFGALSLWGYSTKRDLRPLGVFFFFALWGLVGVSLLSFLFPPSSALETIITVGVLVVSGGLVAYDTQSLKQSYFALEGDQRGLAVMTNWGALNFFILFYNIFTTIMSLLSRD